MFSLATHPLLTRLREATQESHETLDAAFGSLDLAHRDDYVRFLAGHAIGMEPLFGSFRSFVEDDLGLECPDYPAMLRADLSALGLDAHDLPKVSPAAQLSPPAVGYVVAGSRLGLTVIRRNGYWGRDQGLASSYMEDDHGAVIWKQAAAELKQRAADEPLAVRESEAAVAAFDTFRQAFAVSATVVQ